MQDAMRTLLTAAFVLLTSVANAASLPPAGEIDFASPDVYVADVGEVRLPKGVWCLVYSVRNNPGEPRTLVYLRGTYDWCDPSDRVVVKEKRKK
jgi:hypothetical protein